MRHPARALIPAGLMPAVLMLAGLLCAATGAAARDRALVVGVNQYPLVEHGARDLRGAVPDALSFARALETTFKFDPADIKLLRDGEATAAAITSGFENWLIAGSGPGDRVVFFFSGHGATRMVRENGRERPTSTLVASDAAPAGKTFSNMIEGRQIGRYLQRLKDRRVTVFADSCHSGSVTRSLDTPPSGIRTLTPHAPAGLTEGDLTNELRSELKSTTALLDRDLVAASRGGSLAVWSAATVDQYAYDLPDGTGGIFTQSFLHGLHELGMDADTGAAEPGTLFAYVRDKSTAFCRQKGDCSGLTPGLSPPAAWRNFTLAPDPAPAKPDTGGQAASDAPGLLAHRNDFPLDVAILPGPHVRLKEQVVFKITAGEEGTLVVLDAGPDGTLRQLYPNRFAKGKNRTGFVRANAPTSIPDRDYGFAFVATDPGPGQLLVLVADKSVDLSAIIGKQLDAKPASDPRGVVVELAEQSRHRS